METGEKVRLAKSVIGRERQHDASDAEFGTKRSGYAPARCGPYKCGGCSHSSAGGTRCSHPDVVIDKEVKSDGGLAIVEPGGCCRYFRPEDSKCERA